MLLYLEIELNKACVCVCVCCFAVAKVLPQVVPSITPDGARDVFHKSRENGVAVVIVTVKVCSFKLLDMFVHILMKA